MIESVFIDMPYIYLKKDAFYFGKTNIRKLGVRISLEDYGNFCVSRWRMFRGEQYSRNNGLVFETLYNQIGEYYQYTREAKILMGRLAGI